MTRQDQNVGPGGTAIQAHGGVTINQGLSTDQMTEIMISLGKQLHVYQADAERTAEERFHLFREEVLKEFSKPNSANSEAFKDPDFQFVLRGAQNSFAKSGEKKMLEALIQLLSERSKLSNSSRPALVLNKATELVGLLTNEELALLSVMFVLLYTGGIAFDLQSFFSRCNNLISPFIADINLSHHSMDYLESLACISMQPVISRNLKQVVAYPFMKIFTKGFSQQELDDTLEGSTLPIHFPPLLSIDSVSGVIKFNAMNPDDFEVAINNIQISASVREKMKSLFSSKLMSDEEFHKVMHDNWPDYFRLEEIWKGTRMNSASLTLVGKALAYSNVKRVCGIDPPLSIWIA